MDCQLICPCPPCVQIVDEDGDVIVARTRDKIPRMKQRKTLIVIIVRNGFYCGKPNLRKLELKNVGKEAGLCD